MRMTQERAEFLNRINLAIRKAEAAGDTSEAEWLRWIAR